MHITSVSISPVPNRCGLVGFATVVVDDWLRLNSIGIHKRLDGLGFRLTYPTKKAGLHDLNIFHPLTDSGSKAIEEAVLAAFKEVSESSNDRYRGSYPDPVTI